VNSVRNDGPQLLEPIAGAPITLDLA
jgi:hypothetical protein